MRVNPNFTPDILNDLWQSQSAQQTALEQISTGLRVNQPSDDPTAAAEDVVNVALQAQTDQYMQNTSSLEGLLQTADSTLSSVTTALNQAVSLATEAGNSTMSSSDLQAIAEQVQGIQSQLLQLANTNYQGSYIFAGTATKTTPFTLDSTQPDGVVYNGNANVNTVAIADGRNLQINVPGSQIFQNSGGDVFGSLQQLITSLQSGDLSGIQAAGTQLGTALNTLSQQRVFYGNAVNQLTANQSFLQQDKVNLQTEQTALVGANLATSATNLTQAQTTYNATLAALAKVIPNSLLDYLH